MVSILPIADIQFIVSNYRHFPDIVYSVATSASKT